jgi:uncharacterized lipoprotein YmbA
MKNRAGFGNIGRVFFFMVFLLASCSTAPAVRYYTLNPFFEMQPDSSQAVSGDTLAIGVGPVEFPKFLDRPQIVTRKSQNRVEVSEFHRWAGSFSGEFLRVLARNISMLLPADRVAAYPWIDQFSPVYRIPLTVEQFDGRFGGNVVLNVTWSVWNQKDANEPVMKNTRIKEPVSGENYDALVAAQSRAIGTLSRAIVDEIERVNHRDRGFSGSKN